VRVAATVIFILNAAGSKGMAMSIEDQISWWPQGYVRRSGATQDGTFEAYVPGNPLFRLLDRQGVAVNPVREAFIRDWVAADAVVWDIGAKLGGFAFPAALKARQGTVYAIESDAELAMQLRRSPQLPQNRGLHVLPMAVTLSNSDTRRSESLSGFHKSESPTTVTIDTLAKRIAPPDVISMNVPGGAANILAGGIETITRHRPAFLIEGSPDWWTAHGVFFRKLNYVLLDAGSYHSLLERPVWETAAIPLEKYEHSALASVHRVLRL